MYTVIVYTFLKRGVYLKPAQSPSCVSWNFDWELGKTVPWTFLSLHFISLFVRWKNFVSIRFIIPEFSFYAADCVHSASTFSSIRAFDKNLHPETDTQSFLYLVSVINAGYCNSRLKKSLCYLFLYGFKHAWFSKLFFFSEGQLRWRDWGVQASSWANVQIVQAVSDCSGVLHQAPEQAAESSAP